MEQSHLEDNVFFPKNQTIAPSPFDRPDADVVLRSSDNVGFHTFKQILSLASPIFSTMFTLPQPTKVSAAEVISVSEDSHLLGILLAHCYPQNLPELSNVDETVKIWELCKKYEMIGIEARVQKVLVELISNQEPVCAFALATRHGFRKEAWDAAKRALSVPPTRRPYIPELEGITAGQYHRLEEYHYICAQKAVTLIQEPFGWIKTSFVWFGCSCPKSIDGTDERDETILWHLDGSPSASLWWLEYMESCRKSLLQTPVGQTISMTSVATRLALQKAHTGACIPCRNEAFEDMVYFVELFSKKVDRVVSEVIAEQVAKNMLFS